MYVDLRHKPTCSSISWCNNRSRRTLNETNDSLSVSTHSGSLQVHAQAKKTRQNLKWIALCSVGHGRGRLIRGFGRQGGVLHRHRKVTFYPLNITDRKCIRCLIVAVFSVWCCLVIFMVFEDLVQDSSGLGLSFFTSEKLHAALLIDARALRLDDSRARAGCWSSVSGPCHCGAVCAVGGAVSVRRAQKFKIRMHARSAAGDDCSHAQTCAHVDQSTLSPSSIAEIFAGPAQQLFRSIFIIEENQLWCACSRQK